jgi:hypothetical protein
VAAAAGVFLIAGGLTASAQTDTYSYSSSGPSESILWWPYLLTGIILTGLWLLPGLQGRPFLLGAGLLSFIWAVTAFIGVTVAKDKASNYSTLYDLSASNVGDDIRAVLTSAAAAALLCGAVCLVAVVGADRFGFKGVATPVLVAGVTATIGGAFGVVDGGDLLPALLLAGVLVGIIAVGALGGRKATVWIGALGLTPGIVRVMAALLGDDGEPAGYMVLSVIAAVAVAVLAGAVFIWGPMARTALDDAIPGETAPEAFGA